MQLTSVAALALVTASLTLVIIRDRRRQAGAFLEMPAFDHMHRFLPAMMIRAGGNVLSVPVNHRSRTRGTSKYGVWNRLWVGIIDLFGVIWLIRRAANPASVERNEIQRNAS